MPLYRRIPKLKHFPVVNQRRFTIINVHDLSEFAPNTEVNLTSLMEAGIVTADDGPLKVLGDGEVLVALKVQAAAFTATAQQKIEAAGGTCEFVGQ
jgi:large subunit ribosomal protein L15